MNDEELKLKAEHILRKEAPLEFIVKTIQKVHKGDGISACLTYLCGLTPFMPTNQLHVTFMSDSGKGKGDLGSAVLLTFPEKTYKTLTSVSPKALYYAKHQNKLISNGIILIDEIESSADTIPVLRALTSSGRIKPTHLTVDDKKKANELRFEGSYSIWLSSVSPLPDDQLKNRFLFVNVDESKELDEEVWKHQDKVYREGLEQKLSEDTDFLICRNITQILISIPDNVKIPYHIEWYLKENRRLYPFFTIIIKASTFVHKFQRERDLNNCLIATKYDFELALAIWNHIFQFMKNRVNQQALNLLDLIPTNRDNAINRILLSEKSGLPIRTVKYYTDILGDAGLVNYDTLNERGSPNVYWKKFVSDCPYVAKVDWSNSEELNRNLEESIECLRQNPESAKRILESVLSNGVALPYFCRKETHENADLQSKTIDKLFKTNRQIKTNSFLETSLIDLIPVNEKTRVGTFENSAITSNFADKTTLYENFWQFLKKWEREGRIEYITESEIMRRY